MSVVTNVILTHGSFEEQANDQRPYPIVERLNAMLDMPGLEGTFARVDPAAGGRHALEAGVYLGAFDYLLTHRLVERVESLPWERPHEVQLFVMQPDEACFHEVPLFASSAERGRAGLKK